MDPEGLRIRIAENLAGIREQIETVAGGRKITLVCVTKYAQDSWIDALLDSNEWHLGENMLPKGSRKFDALADNGRRFTRHLIGPQQSRKVGLIVGSFDWFQAVDRAKIAGILDAELRERGSKINALLQVNISEEEQKHGVLPEQCIDVFAEIRDRFKNVRLKGLMAIPAAPDRQASRNEFEKNTRDSFEKMKELFDKICRLNQGSPEVDTLSLGMSQDYVWAVQAGATMVRIGSAIYDGLEG